LLAVTSENQEFSENEVTQLNTLVYILDSFNISRHAYHEISMIFKSLPRSYKISEYISHLNSGFE